MKQSIVTCFLYNTQSNKLLAGKRQDIVTETREKRVNISEINKDP